MTTSAITAGFAVCQTRLGAKVHDPKDPGADLGPMFSQVVGTILRLTAAAPGLVARGPGLARRAGLRLRADRRPAAARGEPPPAVASSTRLAAGRRDVGKTLAPATSTTVLELAKEAGTAADRATRALGLGGEGGTAAPSTIEMAEARAASTSPTTCGRACIYDLVIATRRGDVDTDQLVAALIPLYFGRVGSFVIENRDMTTPTAEERVERQARAFELLKPYLVQRWQRRRRRRARS